MFVRTMKDKINTKLYNHANRPIMKKDQNYQEHPMIAFKTFDVRPTPTRENMSGKQKTRVSRALDGLWDSWPVSFNCIKNILF